MRTDAPVIISLGGNALIRRNERGTVEDQIKNAKAAFESVAKMAAAGTPVVITHGNGPIVGNILLRNEALAEKITPMPLYVCDADSEGGIGFVLQQTLHNELIKTGKIKDVAAIVTQTVVNPSDPDFNDPSKPIGQYYSKEEAARISGERGWTMREDSGRGWRRFVPSPRPVRIVEAAVVKKLAAAGVIVIAAGGGGVPVVESPDGTLKGIDAVVDKDLATAVLAKEIGAKLFINLTQVDCVYLSFGKPNQRRIEKMTAGEAKNRLKEGEFARGSMAPKVEAAIEFLESGGEEVIITSPERLNDALEGSAGTRIT